MFIFDSSKNFFTKNNLSDILENKKDYYSIYKKKKSNGKFRVIFAPKPKLKQIQKLISLELDKEYKAPDCVFGFIKGRSSSQLAELHINKDWIISIDIKDFFDNITSKIIKGSICGIDDKFIDIVTYNNHLVQGSPSSPVISNIVLYNLDLKFNKLFRRINCNYGRYADDIFISGYKKPKWSYVLFIDKCLNEIGLKVNFKKVQFMFPNKEQSVLGITVNNKVSLNHKIRKKIKNSLIYSKDIDTLKSYNGYLSYLNDINKEQYKKVKEKVQSHVDKL